MPPMQEIQVPYRVIGERERSQPIFQPGGLGRLAYLLFAIGVVVMLSRIINPLVRATLDAPIRQFATWIGL